MNDGMEELANSVLQVTSTSFDTLFYPTPMTIGWKLGLMRSYRHKIYALPFDQNDELCNKINEMAKNLKSTGDAVTYAVYLVDLRIRYNDEAEEEKLTSTLLETVPEDDSISLPPTTTKSPPTSTKSQNRPPVIVKGIPVSKSSPVMVETVIFEDDTLEVLTLREELEAQRKEQAKITQAVLHQFENLNKGTKIADKGQEMFSKMVLAQTAANFDPNSQSFFQHRNG